MKKMLLAVSLLCLITANPIQATPAKLPLCMACHGQQGVSPNPIWPNLAGQHEGYLIKQLRDYQQDSQRHETTMSAIAKSLSNDDIIELARYYSEQPKPVGKTMQKYLSKGEQLYRGGDINKHITACIACHGPGAQGNGSANFPLLAGQQAKYTIQQLQAFKHQQRRNDISGIMQDICRRMNKDDMKAVAYYLQGLH